MQRQNGWPRWCGCRETASHARTVAANFPHAIRTRAAKTMLQVLITFLCKAL
jgi:hypothetical protein